MKFFSVKRGNDVRLQAGPRGRRGLRDRDRRAGQGRRLTPLPRRGHRGTRRPRVLRSRLGAARRQRVRPRPPVRRGGRAAGTHRRRPSRRAERRRGARRAVGPAPAATTSRRSRPARTSAGPARSCCRSSPSPRGARTCRPFRSASWTRRAAPAEAFLVRWRGEPDPAAREGARRLLGERGRARHERLHVHRPGDRVHRRRRGRRPVRRGRRAVRAAARRRAGPGAAHDRGGGADRRRGRLREGRFSTATTA